MDFAKKLLNKYGWKEGEGLGKNNNGIAKPIKASLKFDSAGFGDDRAASDFNNHWWERVFNEASQNVEVKSEDNGEDIKLDLKDPENEVEISTKGYSVKRFKKINAQNDPNTIYANFMQSATLTNQGTIKENPFKVVEEDIAVTQFKTLTDEELFAACGGRTAHKGARHGLKLSGKLARLEKQEQEMLAKMLKDKNNTESTSNSEQNEKETKDIEGDVEKSENTKNKKKKKKDKHAATEDIQETVDKISKKCKKSKKKKLQLENEDLLEEPHNKQLKQDECVQKPGESVKIKKKKSKRKHEKS